MRAGIDGVLQMIPAEIAEGARVAPGANLARVANPSRLKAEIKVAETQARDIQIGQRAEIDTRVTGSSRAASYASILRCRTERARLTSHWTASCRAARCPT